MQITGVMPGDNQRMELHQLEYFVAVAEELSFTRGARRAHVVQSAVSAAITRLERELNAPLFERSRRRVALTDAGAVLLPEARGTLAAGPGARGAGGAGAGGHCRPRGRSCCGRPGPLWPRPRGRGTRWPRCGAGCAGRCR